MGGKRVFELMLEIGHKSTPLNKKLSNGYTHKWTAYVKGVNNSKIEHCIQRVVFQLHESFDNPYRDISEPPFQIKETGYAGFEIPIQIYFKNKDKPNHLVFIHDLVLLSSKPNSSSTTEKLKFINPNREFERCLIKSGAQLLSVAIKKERSDSPPAKKQKSSSLIPSKDMNKPTQRPPQPQTLPQPQQQAQAHHQPSHHHHQKTSHQNHHGSNHHTKVQAQPQQTPQKPKSSSREFIDMFGAPLVYNNNRKNGREDTREEQHRDERMDERKDERRDDKKEVRKDDRKEERRVERRQDLREGREERKEDRREERKEDRREERKEDRREERKDDRKDERKDDQPYGDLQVIQAKISCLSDCDRLQRIVDIIEEAGEWFNLTPKKFEFDLKRLDKKTLSRIERCLH